MKRTLLLIAGILLAMAGLAKGHDLPHNGKDLHLGDVGYRHSEFHKPYERFTAEVNGGIGFGDENFQREKFGPTYKKLYSSGKCACKSGYCRPTKVRTTELGSVAGYDIYVSGQWIPVPQGSLHNETTLSPELWEELMFGAEAHVCAYPDENQPYGQRIECAIVPEFVG